MKIFSIALLLFLAQVLSAYSREIKVDNVRITGNEHFPAEELLPPPYGTDPDSIISEVRAFYLNNGFAFVHISSEVITDTLEIKIKEGPVCRLRKAEFEPPYVRLPYFENTPRLFIAPEINGEIMNLISSLEAAGKPLARVEVDTLVIKTGSDTVDITLKLMLEDDEVIKIDKIVLPGLKFTRPDVALRELNRLRGRPFTDKNRDEMVQSLRKLKIFSEVKTPFLMKNDSGTAVAIPVKEGQAVFFDGVVGYVPETASGKGDGYFTGLINIDFNNLFGSGRKLTIHWQKPDALSDNFFLRYLEPWILGIPLNGVISLHRRVQDTLFLKQGYKLELEYPFSNNWKIYGIYSDNYTQPDSLAAVERGITDNRHRQYSTGFRYDSRDYSVNPGSGIFADMNFSFGDKTINGPSYLLEKDTLLFRNQHSQQLTARGEAYYSLFRGHVIAMQFSGGYINVYPGEPDEADMFWFGGSRLLRGYRENQFFSDKYAVFTLEYRLLLGRYSRVYAFADNAVFNNSGSRETRLGYGVGLRQKTGIGILAIDYGIAAGDSFSQGKIHFGIVNEF